MVTPPHLRPLLVAGALLALLAQGMPAHADTPNGYVALGDSYASGTGTRTYLDDGTTCRRSPDAYASLVAQQNGLALSLQACNGARLQDVLDKQVEAINESTAFVTLTAGGNDAGFVPTISECAKPAWMSDCGLATDLAIAVIDQDLPSRWDGVLAAVRTRAPMANVVVVGYPRLFNGTDCNAITFFSREEMDHLNEMADRLNTGLAAAASRAGAHFVDPEAAFTGHAVCDDDEWANGASLPLRESFHPNRRGQAALAGLVQPLAPWRDPSLTAGTTDTQAGAADDQSSLDPVRAALSASSAAGQAAIASNPEPVSFERPDLRSAEARRAAARAGIDLSDPASVESWDQ